MRRSRLLETSLLLVLAGCGSGSREESTATPKPLSPEASQALNASITSLVDGYKGGRLSRSEAAQHLADLIEPLSGFATQSADSVELDLFDATRAILQERMATRHGLPDSLR